VYFTIIPYGLNSNQFSLFQTHLSGMLKTDYMRCLWIYLHVSCNS